MQNGMEKAAQICRNASGNKYDIYYALYKDCLLEQEQPEGVLGGMLIEVQSCEFEEKGEGTYINTAVVKNVRKRYFDLLKAYVRMIAHENYEEDEFYKKLYWGVFESGIFPAKEKEKAVLLYLLAEEIPEIPYFYATNLLQMSNEEYKEAVQRIKPQIDRAIDVLNRHFATRTEEASQIYEIMSQMDAREDRIVFLSMYTTVIRKNSVPSSKEGQGR